MILVIAEKPSVARDLARVLGASRKEGYFESATHRVAWALGHLVSYQDPDELDPKYKKWRAEDLPILPDTLGTKVNPKTRVQFNQLKKLMLDKSTTSLVCATDAGREGELIFRLIYEQAGCKLPVERLWISSLTDAAIKEGLARMKPASAYEGLHQSAKCRAQADWLVGMNASRAFTLQYKALLSVGRVQTPTLAILVQRALEIRNFVPQQFWTLKANFGDYFGRWFDEQAADSQTAHRLPQEAMAKSIASQIKGKTGMIKSATTQPKRELPPELFDLTSLQREANRLLGFTAEKTLKTAQSLYERHKCLSYPRTDSKRLPRDMVGKAQAALLALPPPWQDFVQSMPKEDGKLPFSTRVFDDAKVTDHHAIIPTPQAPKLDQLSADEKALFDLVARRFIAAFYPAHEYQQTTIITLVEDQAFKSTGRAVSQQGFKTVLPPAKKKKGEEDEQSLPSLKQGDTRPVKGSTIKGDSTKPPAQHSDASLLLAMERPGLQVEDEDLQETLKKAGLGTPATRASIIERLIQVGYARRQGKVISATEKGEKLIQVVPEDISSPVLTGMWEQALDEIQRQKREPERFMAGIRRLTTHLVQSASQNAKDVQFEAEARGRGGRVQQAQKPVEGIACPLCGQPVVENAKAFGCSDWKKGCAFTLWKDGFKRFGGPGLTARLVKLLLTEKRVQGSTGMLELSSEQISFTPTLGSQPAHTQSIRYVKAARTAGEKPSTKPKTSRTAKPKG